MSKLAELKEKLKRHAVMQGQIVFIPKGIQQWRCENSFHGTREKVFHSFTPRNNEISCDCGTIYRKET
jgi:hypothetical protein